MNTSESGLPGSMNSAPPEAGDLPSAASLTQLANELFGTFSHGGYIASGVPQSTGGKPVQNIPVSLPDHLSHRAAVVEPPVSRFTLPSSALAADDERLKLLLAPRRESKPSSDAAPPTADHGYYFMQSAHAVAGPAQPLNLSGLTIRPELIGTATSAALQPFDVQSVRRDFPVLQERVNGHPLVWLDNAATTQKPQVVIDRLKQFYQHENSNIHRAAHEMAARATDAYEKARETVARFINASSSREIVFVRGGTEAINLVAQSWGRQNVGAGDEIVITWLEHHANIVPWQQLAAEKGAVLRVAPVDNQGQVLLDEYQKLLGPKTRLVAFTLVSNALGTVTPAMAMTGMAHRHGARVLVDAAQSVAHSRTDVQALDSDWLVFSGHKVFGPTGIGVLHGREALLNATVPWQGGGNMIQNVTFEKTTYQPAPARFEAGTGNIADAVGLGAAIDYINGIGMENIARYEHDLMAYATASLARVPGLQLVGTAPEKASVLSFVLEGFQTEDVGQALNECGIAVRAGHHCAQPILRRFGLESTVRPSLAMYNTYAEIDALAAALQRLTTTRPRAGGK